MAEGVIFYSYMSQNSPANLGTHHNLQFNVNPVNKGKGYHIDNGIFEAPRVGIYVFLWSIYTESRGYIGTELVVNGHAIGSALADSHLGDGIMGGTGIAIAELSVGDHVYLRTINFIRSVQDGRSTFSGWLLH
jgi:hypothetical protein